MCSKAQFELIKPWLLGSRSHQRLHKSLMLFIKYNISCYVWLKRGVRWENVAAVLGRRVITERGCRAEPWSCESRRPAPRKWKRSWGNGSLDIWLWPEAVLCQTAACLPVSFCVRLSTCLSKWRPVILRFKSPSCENCAFLAEMYVEYRNRHMNAFT